MRIKEARIKAGYTQPEFRDILQANGCVLDVPTLSKYENEWSNPTPKQAIAICKAVAVTLGELARPDEVRFCMMVVKSAAKVKRQPKRIKAGRIMFRILESERPQVDEALRVCGYSTIQSWGDEKKAELLEAALHKQRERDTDPPAGVALAPITPGGEYDPFNEIVEVPNGNESV